MDGKKSSECLCARKSNLVGDKIQILQLAGLALAECLADDYGAIISQVVASQPVHMA